MEFGEFVILLEKRLQLPLPGNEAQMRMSSLTRVRELMKQDPATTAVRSAVLLLLYPLNGNICFVLMLRPEYPGVHSGQISLPGGKLEESDLSLQDTALREAQEEIGIDPAKIRIIGQLTDLYIPPSNFMVTPVVGFQRSQPQFLADPGEVAAIIEVELGDLLDPLNVQLREMKISNGMKLTAPAYCIGENTIWGATAMILSEFTAVLGDILKNLPGN
ncbi:MAG: CoA pyrophosphatase [Bacteroidota bacterium]